MSKVRPMAAGGQVFSCPGFGRVHQLNTQPAKAVWEFNGDLDRPTFRPSILVRFGRTAGEGQVVHGVCHSYVTEGRIQFLDDCTHTLAGATVEIPEWPFPPGGFAGVIDQ
jgi:Family of unknown function (DUF6527)